MKPVPAGKRRFLSAQVCHNTKSRALKGHRQLHCCSMVAGSDDAAARRPTPQLQLQTHRFRGVTAQCPLLSHRDLGLCSFSHSIRIGRHFSQDEHAGAGRFVALQHEFDPLGIRGIQQNAGLIAMAYVCFVRYADCDSQAGDAAGEEADVLDRRGRAAERKKMRRTRQVRRGSTSRTTCTLSNGMRPFPKCCHLQDE